MSNRSTDATTLGQRLVALAAAVGLTAVLGVLAAAFWHVVPERSDLIVDLVGIALGLAIVPAVSFVFSTVVFYGPEAEENSLGFLLPYFRYIRLWQSSWERDFDFGELWIHGLALLVAPPLQVIGWGIVVARISAMLDAGGVVDQQAFIALAAGALVAIVGATIIPIASRTIQARAWQGSGAIDPTHEWRRLDTGVRTGPATRKEVYEHYHGRGSFGDKAESDVFMLWVFATLGGSGATLLLYLLIAPGPPALIGWVGLAVAALIVWLLALVVVSWFRRTRRETAAG